MHRRTERSSRAVKMRWAKQETQEKPRTLKTFIPAGNRI
jgi:hypothetical protein